MSQQLGLQGQRQYIFSVLIPLKVVAMHQVLHQNFMNASYSTSSQVLDVMTLKSWPIGWMKTGFYLIPYFASFRGLSINFRCFVAI